MPRKESLLIYTIIFLVVLPIHAVIGRGEIWRKKQENGVYQFVYAMFDLHIEPALSQYLSDTKKIYALAQTQFESLVSIIKKLDKNERLIIAEDPFTNQDGSLVTPKEILIMLEKIEGDRGKDLLTSFIYRMQQSGIEPVINIDFRKKRTVGFAHLTNMVRSAQLEIMMANPGILEQVGGLEVVKTMWDTFQKAGMNTASLQQYGAPINFKMKDLLDELYIEINKIKNYQDGPILAEYYKEKIGIIESGNKKILELMQTSKEKTLLEFSNDFDVSKAVPFGAGFLHIGSSLLDCNALHEIYKAQNSKKKILLIAGSIHVLNIGNMLSKLGYELINETGLNRVSLKGGPKIMSQLESLDLLMNRSSEESVKTGQKETQLVNALVAQLSKKMPFNPAFFDLILSDNPEPGWQPGHGPIQ